MRAVQERTREAPAWIHFGAGNIFRAYIARLQHQLLTEGLVSGGILAAELFDGQVIDEIYRPHDNLTLLVTMHADGKLNCEVTAGIGASARRCLEGPPAGGCSAPPSESPRCSSAP